MKANCKTCKHRLDLKKWDFKEKGVEHTDLDGFACDLFGNEGVIIWQVGNEDGYCEEYKPNNKESISLGVYEQVKWERDMAIQQLAELGYSFGEKPRKDDCISRQMALDVLLSDPGSMDWQLNAIKELPSIEQYAPDTNVGDMVSRQKAIDAMCLACGHDCDKSKFVYNAPQDEQVIMCPEHYALSTLPSAQPEIIRCKDCKWKQGAECVRFAEVRPFPDDFCSRAERRTDE